MNGSSPTQRIGIDTYGQKPTNTHLKIIYSLILIIFFQDFIYLWEGEKERERQYKQREEQRKRISRPHALSMEPHMGFDLMTLKSWPEPKSRAGCLTNWATHVPLFLLIIMYNFYAYFFIHLLYPPFSLHLVVEICIVIFYGKIYT